MNKKPKEIQTVTMTYADYVSRYDGDFPSRYMFRDAMGDYVFVITGKKAIAEQYLVDNYGKGVYSLREV